MEYHEDVVLANSLDAERAIFEFSQVKNITSPKFNTTNLTKRKSGKSSVLGKLISSVAGKPFEHQISKINLVASCGFNINQIDNSLKLETITLADLADKEKEKLLEALSEELGIDELPVHLQFIIPALGIVDQQDTVVGKFSSLVAEKYPDSHCNAINIYRALIDDLHRKGVVKYDYKNWDEFLEKKALTSTSVTQVITNHISQQNRSAVDREADEIGKELGYDYYQRKALRQAVNKIHLNEIGFPTSKTISTRETISALIDTAKPSEGLQAVVDTVYNSLTKDERYEIGDNATVIANIVYEIIRHS
jgi:hypothetical protein